MQHPNAVNAFIVGSWWRLNLTAHNCFLAAVMLDYETTSSIFKASNNLRAYRGSIYATVEDLTHAPLL